MSFHPPVSLPQTLIAPTLVQGTRRRFVVGKEDIYLFTTILPDTSQQMVLSSELLGRGLLFRRQSETTITRDAGPTLLQPGF